MTAIPRSLQLLILVVLFGCAVDRTGAYALPPDKGVFLIADEQLVDPRFHGRVILLFQHDAQGSAGLVINRTSRLPLARLLPDDSKLVGREVLLAYGGPVEPQTLLVLAKVRNLPPEPAEEVIDGLYLTGIDVLDEWPEFDEQVIVFRAFAGYAGWAPGQLEVEISKGDWLMLPAEDQSIFAEADALLWERLYKSAREQN